MPIGDQKRLSDPLNLEFEVVVSHQVGLGPELWSPESRPDALNYKASFPTLASWNAITHAEVLSKVYSTVLPDWRKFISPNRGRLCMVVI